MKNYLAGIAMLAVSITGSAQVAQKIITEHFTNTRCSVCGSRNPGLVGNFTSNKDVLHVAIHPSSPYSSCILNKHNVSENDGRTRFYSIYGSTPKIVINGEVKSAGTNFGSSTLFDDYKNKTTEISLEVAATKTDSTIKIEVTAKAAISNTLGTQKIAVFLVEDTVFYNAPNGEKQHLNVFRKSLTAVEGDDIALPVDKDKTVTKSYSYKADSEWELNRMRAIVIIQNSADKSLIQAEQSNNVSAAVVAPSSVTEIKSVNSLVLFPNPTEGKVHLVGINTEPFSYKIFNVSGELVEQGSASNKSIDASSIEFGLYTVLIEQNEQLIFGRFQKH